LSKRPLPVLTSSTGAFWTGGRHGELLIHRCRGCAYWVHPPAGFCPRCEGRAIIPEAVSGRATVASLTINYQRWEPDMEVPYVLALVELEEQADVRLATNIVNCLPETVRIGMPVEVLFEQNEDVWVPLFQPRTGG
jgi:hypothetical protein